MLKKLAEIRERRADSAAEAKGQAERYFQKCQSELEQAKCHLQEQERETIRKSQKMFAELCQNKQPVKREDLLLFKSNVAKLRDAEQVAKQAVDTATDTRDQADESLHTSKRLLFAAHKAREKTIKLRDIQHEEQELYDQRQQERVVEDLALTRSFFDANQ